MSDVVEILPGNTPPFTRALAAGMSDDLPVPYRDETDPDTCSPAMLPFLAARESVDLWFEDWPLERKRRMVREARELAALKGTRKGLKRFLEFVDAEIVDVVAHPSRFVLGRSAIGLDPVGHQPFVAHYLIKVTLVRPVAVFEFGKAVLGSSPLTVVDLEPIRRAKIACVAAKAPETAYSVTFAWRRRATFRDILPDEETQHFSGFIDRARM